MADAAVMAAAKVAVAAPALPGAMTADEVAAFTSAMDGVDAAALDALAAAAPPAPTPMSVPPGTTDTDLIAAYQTAAHYAGESYAYQMRLRAALTAVVAPPPPPPPPGTYVWVMNDVNPIIQKGRIIRPLPSSPKPRQSLGVHQVRVYPPPRTFTKPGGGTITKQPTVDDWRIPENTMVFRVVRRHASKLNYTGAPESAKRRRTAVVEDVFANWSGRAFGYETLPKKPAPGATAAVIDEWKDRVEAVKRQDDYDIEFAGVSYEGVTDPVAAARVPDIKGRFTVSVNGIVSLHLSVCARQVMLCSDLTRCLGLPR